MSDKKLRTITTKDGISITDVPGTLDDQNDPNYVPSTDPRIKALIDKLRASGQTSASFSSIAAPATTTAAAPALTSEEMAALTSEQALMAGQGPKIDMSGMLGAAVRGAGPIAAGTLAGAAAGSVIPGVGTAAGAAAGGGAMAAAQFIGDPLVDVINGLFGTQLTKPTEALNQLFTALGVPEPDTWAERIVQASAAGGAEAAGSVLLGQALAQGSKQLAPSVTKAIGDALAAGATQQVAGGIGSGLAAQGAAELGAGPGVQLAAGVGGGMIGSGLGALRPTPSKIAQAPLDEAAAAGVRILPSDVNPPTTRMGQRVQQRIDDLPFGPSGLRAKQGVERTKAVQAVLRDLGADDLTIAYSDIADDLLKTRLSTLKKWKTQKMDVISSLASDAPADAVPMSKTQAAIDEALVRLKRLGADQDLPLVKKLENWKAISQGKALDTIEDLRAGVFSSKADPELGVIKDKSDQIINAIYKAVKEDMHDFIKLKGGDKAVNQWEVASKNLYEMVQDLDINSLKYALNKGDIKPEAIRRALFTRDATDVKVLYKNLSPYGQARARSAVLSQAVEKAGKDADADAIVKELRKLELQVGIVFPEAEEKQIKGLMRVIEFTNHAKEGATLPKTGAQTALPIGAIGSTIGLTQLFGGDVVTGGLLTGGAMLGTGMLATGYNAAYSAALKNPEVRKILATLPTLAKGSKEEFALIHRLSSTLQAMEQAPKPSPEEVAANQAAVQGATKRTMLAK